MPHQHGLNQIPILQSEQKLDRPVLGLLLHMLGQRLNDEVVRKQLNALGIHIRHLCEVRNPLHIE
ncbi:hypothetical protein D3C81_927440 [compost metagenome]